MAQFSLISSSGRTADLAWPSVHSWYGGLPRLEKEISWPTGPNGQPLHFLAQLDLSKVSSMANDLGCPTGGHLAFFANTEFDQPQNAVQHEIYGEYYWPCAVVYVKNAPKRHTALPPDARPVHGASWQYYFPGGDAENPPKNFDRLAVEFADFDATSENFTERLHLHWKKNPSYSPSVQEFEVSGNPSDVLWRTVCIVCQECLAAIESQENLLNTFFADREDTPKKKEKFFKHRPAAQKILAMWLERANQNDLNDSMGTQSGGAWMNDLDDLKTTFQEIRVTSKFVGEFNSRPGCGGHMDVPYYWYHGRATNLAYLQMLTGSDADFAALPEQVRKSLWRDRSLGRYPPNSQDMFCGVDADGNINPISDELRKEATLLLELNSSVLWTWGDAGKLQFWIQNLDLFNRGWDKCFLLLRSS